MEEYDLGVVVTRWPTNAGKLTFPNLAFRVSLICFIVSLIVDLDGLWVMGSAIEHFIVKLIVFTNWHCG